MIFYASHSKCQSVFSILLSCEEHQHLIPASYLVNLHGKQTERT